jgi:hypothetical protein
MAETGTEFLLRATGRRGRSVEVPEVAERLSRALGDWERVKGRDDQDDEKRYAAFQLQAATKASEESRRPRNADGTFAAGFDGGYRGGRRSLPHSRTHQTANMLFKAALETSAQETREARDDPGTTVIVP